MLTTSDLKRIPLFEGVEDALLDRIVEVSTTRRYEQYDVIYEAGWEAKDVFLVKNGKVLLENDLTPAISVTLESLKPGYVFGWPALMDGGVHHFRAVAGEPGDVILIPGELMRELMADNYRFGAVLMKRMFSILRGMYIKRTDKLLRILRRHPDLQIE